MNKRALTLGPFLLLALGACSDDGPSGNTPDTVARVAVNPPVPVVAPGADLQLSATTADSRGDDATLTYNVSAAWRSLDTDVATVNSRGVVRGAREGKARIVATVRNQQDTATVFVSATPLQGINASAFEACYKAVPVGARVAATSQRATILHDIDNPAGGLTDAEYQEFASAFDQLVWPSNVENFGDPSDIDGGGRVKILFTRRVNELTAGGSNVITAGFFYSRDLFPQRGTSELGGCPSSNHGEIFYVLAADPGGAVNGNVRSKEYVRSTSLSTIAHEFQHLINSGRRIHINKVPSAQIFETTWLDEGLAHVAEELAFYRAAGLAPGQDLTRADLSSTNARLQAFINYGDQNLGRLEDYLRAPASDTPLGTGPLDDDLATRGAAWQFLRYAADRRGGNQRDLWFALANGPAIGFENLDARLGGEALNWMRDWSVAMYADNAVPGIAAQYSQPSWNFREILGSQWYSNTGRSPLQIRNLANGTALPLVVRGGSSAHVRFGVAPGTRAELRTTSGGGTVDGSCTVNGSTPALAVGQVFSGDPSNASVLCLDGGATGAEYVYIPFFASTAGNSTLALEVTGTNVVPVTTMNPAWIPGAAMPQPLAQIRAVAEAERDGGLHLALRRRERAELSRLVRRGGDGPRFDVAAAQAPATLRISILRTR